MSSLTRKRESDQTRIRFGCHASNQSINIEREHRQGLALVVTTIWMNAGLPDKWHGAQGRRGRTLKNESTPSSSENILGQHLRTPIHSCDRFALQPDHHLSLETPIARGPGDDGRVPSRVP